MSHILHSSSLRCRPRRPAVPRNGWCTSSFALMLAPTPPAQRLARKRAETKTLAKDERLTLLDNYVSAHGGTRVIQKILIANNGIAAVKAIRSMRRWAYIQFGDEHTLYFVAMATIEDQRANAEYIKLADELVTVPGGPNHNNYANVDLIVDIAERTRVDAVWAGWGHASENPKLPDKLETTKDNIVFIGPPGAPMRALGDKISATLLAQSADVAVLPWSGAGLTIIDYAKEGIPDDTFHKATVHSYEEAKAVMEKIGLPMMIKASEGGGGKGIRKVETEEALEAAFRQVASEVPGSPIFIMRLATKCRHLEVQLLADNYGEAIALYGRDCSVQRRHQKITEEGPVLAAPPHIWSKMEDAAVRMAKSVGYIGAGTVEYLFTEGPPSEDGTPGGDYCFLELNPRLQVEHPVTEWISGVNLPAAQLQVAMGIPLHRIPDIRRMYGEREEDSSVIEFASRTPKEPNGHVMAVRITAENPEAGFQPMSGNIQEVTFRSTPDVWGYFSVVMGGLHEFADSQFGHLFAWAPTREAARKNMVVALKEISIRGEINTPVEYLIKVLETDDFRGNRFDTSWLDSLISSQMTADKPEPITAVLAGAAYRAASTMRARHTEYSEGLRRGQIPPKNLLVHQFPVELILDNVKYSFNVAATSTSTFLLSINGCCVEAEVRSLGQEESEHSNGLLVLLDGRSYPCFARQEPTGMRFSLGNRTCFFSKEQDPSKLLTTTSGKLVRYLVESGTHAPAGTPYVEIEVMKMLMPLTTTASGVIHTLKPPGSVIEGGDVLATLDLDDMSMVSKVSTFEGLIPAMRPPSAAYGLKVQQVLRARVSALRAAAQGFTVSPYTVGESSVNVDGVDVMRPPSKPQDEERLVRRLIAELLRGLTTPLLPVLEYHEVLSSLESRLPEDVFAKIKRVLQVHESLDKPSGGASGAEQQVEVVNRILAEHVATLSQPDAVAAFELVVAPLRELSEAYKDGLSGHALAIVSEVLQGYLAAEEVWGRAKSEDAVVLSMREQNGAAPEEVMSVIRARVNRSRRNSVALAIMERIGPADTTFDSDADSTPVPRLAMEPIVMLIHALSDLPHRAVTAVSLKAKEMLMLAEMPSFEQRRANISMKLIRLYRAPSEEDRASLISALISQSSSLFDVLSEMLMATTVLRVTAAEVYVRRAYHDFEIQGFKVLRPTREELAKLDPGPSKSAVEMLSGSEIAAGDYLAAEWYFGRKSQLPIHMNTAAQESSMDTFDDLSMFQPHTTKKFRYGLMLTFHDLESFASSFEARVKQHFAPYGADSPAQTPGVVLDGSAPAGSPEDARPVHTIKAVLPCPSGFDEESWVAAASAKVAEHSELLGSLNVRRVTFLLLSPGAQPKYYTMRNDLNFGESKIHRHIDPPLAHVLELKKLSRYSFEAVNTGNQNVHMYYGELRKEFLPTGPGAKAAAAAARRVFVRTAPIHDNLLVADPTNVDFHMARAQRTVLSSLNALDVALASDPERFSNLYSNHLFLSFETPIVGMNMDGVLKAMYDLVHRYGSRMANLGVTDGEFKATIRPLDGSESKVLRLIISNPTRFVLQVDTYKEVLDVATGEPVYSSLDSSNPGPLDGQSVESPYPGLDPLHAKRARARALDTTYVYDFPALFSKQIDRIWAKFCRTRGLNVAETKPSEYFSAKRFVLVDDALAEAEQADGPGPNDCGMVLWRITMKTPEAPAGRTIVVIANDITYQAGSFGPEEDRLFFLGSEMSRKEGLPRIYIAANSGARLGLAEEVRERFRVAWVDESNPEKGLDYLYLTPEDYDAIGGASVVNTTEVVVGSERRLRLVDVLGSKHGLNIENLMGSGLIAGETSAAYQDVFTLSYVSGRSVGIGAYLVRLGQRVIQNVGQPILLTGQNALNKVLGREVYTSNEQLGGTQIMHRNGVSHVKVSDDAEGVAAILTWLSYVPKSAKSSIPHVLSADQIDRPVQFVPPESGSYDPRHLIAGVEDPLVAGGKWVGGLFDRGSWQETLDGWAKTVVVGRAHLGGIPCGVIAVETRVTEAVIPADPANPDSHEQVMSQAGQVWYPDSAFKTATAIRDFNYGERLPLFIIANWRGFSGGMRDMFESVLKYGSFIVDELRVYEQPIMIYIPPRGELRGGAWVVLDRSINPSAIEMYMDPAARGGVLEPEGTVEIKFRKPALVAAMKRLDETCRQAQAVIDDEGASAEAKASARAQLTKREGDLLPVYSQVAVAFADAHDTAGRAKAKGAIRDAVPLARAREYFYWRLRRRLAVSKLRAQVGTASPDSSKEDVDALVLEWFLGSDSPKGSGATRELNTAADWENDRLVLRWIKANDGVLQGKLKELRAERVKKQMAALFAADPEGAAAAAKELLG